MKIHSGGNKLDQKPDDRQKNEKPGNMLALGIAMGIAVGAGIGVAIENIAVGVGIGLAIGVAVGAVLEQRNKNSDAKK